MATKQNTDYVFRNMKVYGSTEWLADNKKKYRTVFDKNEATYIYTEFSFLVLKFATLIAIEPFLKTITSFLFVKVGALIMLAPTGSRVRTNGLHKLMV